MLRPCALALMCSGAKALIACAGADDIQDPQEKYIQVEVWDHKFIKHFRGRVDIPLKSVLDNGKVKDRYRFVSRTMVSRCWEVVAESKLSAWMICSWAEVVCRSHM